MLREVPPTKKDGEREITVEGNLFVGPMCMRVSLEGTAGMDVVGNLEE